MRPAYLALPSDHCFDYRLLLDALREYRSARDKISLMLERGEVLRLRKGLYVRSREYGGTVDPISVANALYGPSYVSLSYALARHGLIPERVESMTCVTVRRTAEFSTPLGRFVYKHIPPRAYPAGVTLDSTSGVGVLMATKEKALCDEIAQTPHLRTLRDVQAFVLEDRRLDETEVSRLSLGLLREIAEAYGTQCMSLLVRWFQSRYANAGASS